MELIKYEAARRALVEAQSIDEVSTIRDLAVAMQTYAKMAKDSELIDRATDIRLRAERRAGEILIEMSEAGQRAKGGGDLRKELKPATLSDLGVTKTESSRWQKSAAMTDDEFEKKVADAKREAIRSVEVTAAERQEEKKERRAEREVELADKIQAMPDKLYGVIYIDPPWRFEPYSRETGMDRSADNHYPTMTIEELSALVIPAASDCAIYMWATVPMLVEALDLMKYWDFTYKSHIAWDKIRHAHGYWAMN